MININHKKPWGWDWGYFLLRLICPMSAESVLISWQKTYSLKKNLYRAFNENVKSKGILQFHKKKEFKCGAVTIMNISYGYSLVLCIICILYFIPHGSHGIWWTPLSYLRLVTFFSLSASWLVSLSTSPPRSEAPWPAVSSLSPLLMSCNTVYIGTSGLIQ